MSPDQFGEHPRTVICPDCDGQVSLLATACPHCGRPMDQEVAGGEGGPESNAAPVPNPPSQVADTAQAVNPGGAVDSDASTRSRMLVLTGAIAAVVVLLAGIGVLFWRSQQPPSRADYIDMLQKAYPECSELQETENTTSGGAKFDWMAGCPSAVVFSVTEKQEFCPSMEITTVSEWDEKVLVSKKGAVFFLDSAAEDQSTSPQLQQIVNQNSDKVEFQPAGRWCGIDRPSE